MNTPTSSQVSDEDLDVQCVVSELPPLSRTVLELRMRERLSYPEIAEEMELTTETIKERMRLALTRCGLIRLASKRR